MPDENNLEQKTEFFNLKNMFKNVADGKNQEGVLKSVRDPLKSMASEQTKTNKILTDIQSALKAGGTKKADDRATAKSLVRKEDPMKRQIKELNDIENAIRDGQKMEKKKGAGILSVLGGLLTVGGLLGYLVTGKKEMLFSVVKGIAKYSPVKAILGLMDNAFKLVSKGIMKIPGVKSLSKNIAKFVAKPFLGITKNFGKVFGKIFGKGAAKAGTKGAAKGLGKTFLKKIPIVGGLLGLFFGIQRFKKGDWVGGLLEVASGFASVVPGVGTALGIAIDAFLLVRDFKKPEGKEPEKPKKKKINWSKVPVIGNVMGIMDGFKLWKTDKMGAVGMVLKNVATMVPGTGWIFDKVMGIIDFFKGKDKDPDSSGGAFDAMKTPVKTVAGLAVGGSKAIGKGIWAGVKGIGKGAMAAGGLAMKAGKAMAPGALEALKFTGKVAGGGAKLAGKGLMGTAKLGLKGLHAAGDAITGMGSVKGMIKRHEGLRLETYKDSLGYPTIGYGHLLLPHEKGLKNITQEQADAMFEQDFGHHYDMAKKTPGFNKANKAGQAAMIDLTYNMGGGWWKKWKNTSAALREGRWKDAARGLLNSNYAKQVGPRAVEIAGLIASNADGSGGGGLLPRTNIPGEGSTGTGGGSGTSPGSVPSGGSAGGAGGPGGVGMPTTQSAGATSNLPNGILGPQVDPKGATPTINLSQESIAALALAITSPLKPKRNQQATPVTNVVTDARR